MSVGGTTLTLWRIIDGKRGHDNQSQGLCQALARLEPCQQFDIPTTGLGTTLPMLLRRDFSPGEHLPNPDLIISAGHASHLPALAARRARGGRVVVLMKPSLPLQCFDFCLIPAHDGVAEGPHVVQTHGPINTCRLSDQHDPEQGLILIGGPSRHHDWDENDLLTQIRKLLRTQPNVRWILGDSRRTPATTRAGLCALAGEGAAYTPSEESPNDWINLQMARAGQVWISEDSVSMIHESLTSGSATGLLRVPKKRHSRLSLGLQALLDTGQVSTYADWEAGRSLSPPGSVLDEATRCASLIRERWSL